MLKILLRTLIILLVTGMVAAVVYLFAENGGVSLLGIGNLPAGMQNGALSAKNEMPTQSEEGEIATRPERNENTHGRGGHESGMGGSLIGLAGVAMQLGKITVITAGVVGLRALMRLFKRRRLKTNITAA